MVSKDDLLKALHLVKDYEHIIVENNQMIADFNKEVNDLQEENRKNKVYITGLEQQIKTFQPAHDLLNDPEIHQILNDINLITEPPLLPVDNKTVTDDSAVAVHERPTLKEELKKIGHEFKTSLHNFKN